MAAAIHDLSADAWVGKQRGGCARQDNSYTQE
jgi:hypothetical protein